MDHVGRVGVYWASTRQMPRGFNPKRDPVVSATGPSKERFPMRARTIFYSAAVSVLLASLALAQSQKSTSPQPGNTATTVHTAREVGSGMATGRKSAALPGQPAAQVTTTHETGSGMATGRKSGSVIAQDFGKTADSSKPQASGTQENPLYQGGGSSGANPLYEPKNRTAAKPGAAPSKPAAYKDGEDGVVHTRPSSATPKK